MSLPSVNKGDRTCRRAFAARFAIVSPDGGQTRLTTSRPQAAPRCAEGAPNGHRYGLAFQKALAFSAGLFSFIILCRPFCALLKKGARRCLRQAQRESDRTLIPPCAHGAVKGTVCRVDSAVSRVGEGGVVRRRIDIALISACGGAERRRFSQLSAAHRALPPVARGSARWAVGGGWR